jgi:hypothetical protein
MVMEAHLIPVAHPEVLSPFPLPPSLAPLPENLRTTWLPSPLPPSPPPEPGPAGGRVHRLPDHPHPRGAALVLLPLPAQAGGLDQGAAGAHPGEAGEGGQGGGNGGGGGQWRGGGRW